MFDATATAYGDPSFVDTKALYKNKISPWLKDIDICFQTSLAPNGRSKQDDTITYLVQDVKNTSTAFTVPIPVGWCVGDHKRKKNGWSYGGRVPSNEGLVYEAPENFQLAYANFPMYDIPNLDSVFTKPDGEPSGSVNMKIPFGGNPTVNQIATASSSAAGYFSDALVTVIAQLFSIFSYDVKHSKEISFEKKFFFQQALTEAQRLLWKTGLTANLATCSAWTDPNPKDMPECQKDDLWFYDGDLTDGPGVGNALARYQKAQKNDDDHEIKIIISNNNNVHNNNNNVLGYFNTSFNKIPAFCGPIGPRTLSSRFC